MGSGAAGTGRRPDRRRSRPRRQPATAGRAGAGCAAQRAAAEKRPGRCRATRTADRHVATGKSTHAALSTSAPAESMETALATGFSRRGDWRRAPRARGGASSAETLLRRFGRESGCAVSILRAPGIYAADRLPLERLRRGLPLLRPEEDIYTNHIHAEDLGRACLAALERGGVRGARLQCRGRFRHPDGRLVRQAGRRLCPAAPPRVTRAEAERVLPPVQLSFMRESRRLDNTRLKRELRLRLALSRPSMSASPTPGGKPHALGEGLPHHFRRQLVRRPLLPAAHLRQSRHGAGGQFRRARAAAADGEKALPLRHAHRRAGGDPSGCGCGSASVSPAAGSTPRPPW